MRANWSIGVLGSLVLGLSGQAHALTITPASGGCTTNVNSNLSEAAVESWVASCFANAADLTLLYKSEVGGGETGTFAGSYETTYSNTATDPSDALIDYIGGAAIACPSCYLLVKDGNSNPAQYLFDISAWNGTEDLVLTGFWPRRGAISNVQVWGAARSVPEPATLALLGVGLLGSLAARRRSRAG